MNTTTIVVEVGQFKQIINNIVIKNKVFDHVKRIHHQLGFNHFGAKKKKENSECYKWVDIYSSFNLLVRFGRLNELKYRLENEGIDKELYDLYNSTANNNEKKEYHHHGNQEGEEIDHRIIGLGVIACRYGHLKIIEYLNQHRQSSYAFVKDDIYYAIQYGHQEIAEYLFDNISEGYEDRTSIVEATALRGYNQLLERMLVRWKKDPINFGYADSIDTLRIIHKYNHKVSESTINYSIERCDLEMVKFINQHYPKNITSECLESMKIDHLDIFKYLFENNSNIKGSEECISYAARAGQLELLKELIQENPEQLDDLKNSLMKSQHIPILEYLKKEHGMKLKVKSKDAITKGNLELIKYYHENGVDLNDAMVTASTYGQLDIVKYLHYNVPDIDCDEDAMDKAARDGHLDIVEFLHQHRTEGCTMTAMTCAIYNNHFEVVKFLHQQRTKGYNPESITRISLEILKFLHLNRTEQLHSNTFTQAINDSNLDVIKYIHYNLPYITLNPVKGYNTDNLEIVKFLTTNREDLKIRFASTSNPVLKYFVDNHIDMIPDDFMQGLDTQWYGKYDVERVHLICRIFKHKGIEPSPLLWTGLKSLEAIKYRRLFAQHQSPK